MIEFRSENELRLFCGMVAAFAEPELQCPDRGGVEWMRGYRGGRKLIEAIASGDLTPELIETWPSTIETLEAALEDVAQERANERIALEAMHAERTALLEAELKRYADALAAVQAQSTTWAERTRVLELEVSDLRKRPTLEKWERLRERNRGNAREVVTLRIERKQLARAHNAQSSRARELHNDRKVISTELEDANAIVERLSNERPELEARIAELKASNDSSQDRIRNLSLSLNDHDREFREATRKLREAERELTWRKASGSSRLWALAAGLPPLELEVLELLAGRLREGLEAYGPFQAEDPRDLGGKELLEEILDSQVYAARELLRIRQWTKLSIAGAVCPGVVPVPLPAGVEIKPIDFDGCGIVGFDGSRYDSAGGYEIPQQHVEFHEGPVLVGQRWTSIGAGPLGSFVVVRPNEATGPDSWVMRRESDGRIAYMHHYQRVRGGQWRRMIETPPQETNGTHPPSAEDALQETIPAPSDPLDLGKPRREEEAF